MSATRRRAQHPRLAAADLGSPIRFWRGDRNWLTEIGPVSVPQVDEGNLTDFGPVILVRRERLLDIMAGKPQPLPTAWKMDERNRLFLTITGDNGSWTWRVRAGENVEWESETLVAVWCD